MRQSNPSHAERKERAKEVRGVYIGADHRAIEPAFLGHSDAGAARTLQRQRLPLVRPRAHSSYQRTESHHRGTAQRKRVQRTHRTRERCKSRLRL